MDSKKNISIFLEYNVIHEIYFYTKNWIPCREREPEPDLGFTENENKVAGASDAENPLDPAPLAPLEPLAPELSSNAEPPRKPAATAATAKTGLAGEINCPVITCGTCVYLLTRIKWRTSRRRELHEYVRMEA